jgi:hypothetical protein
MAATISINFTTPEEVFSPNPPPKKSVSGKVLADVLGGGVIGGGYLQRTGGSMTGFLTLTAKPPTEPWHAVPKTYVDERSFTRRYTFTSGVTISANQYFVYGRDDVGNNLLFFQSGDTVSQGTVYKYVDVFRNGILQVYGQDYEFKNVEINDPNLQRILPHTIAFFTPLLSGSNIQVNIGNTGAMPTVVGVASLTGFPGSGIRVQTITGSFSSSGDLSLSAYPADFVATRQQVLEPRNNEVMITPINLSAFPLMPKAFGVYRKDPPRTGIEYFEAGYERGLPADAWPYGSSTGVFQFIKGFNMGGLFSGKDGKPVETFSCVISSGVFQNTNYVPQIACAVFSQARKDDAAYGIVYTSTRTLTSFDFTMQSYAGIPPFDVEEVQITIF